MLCALSAALFGVSSASAATEVGNSCTGNSAPSGITLVQLANAPGNPLPAAVPAAGVVTRWKVNVVPFPGSFAESLKVFRPTGAPLQFTTVAESSPGAVVSGTNAFSTRISVQPGDHFGVYGAGEPGSLICNTENPADKVGLFAGATAIGAANTFTEAEKAQVAAVAVIEPDADGDGFGDETQDKCPQSAATQAPCPVVTLDSFAVATKGSVIVIVGTNETAPVTVSATAKLPKGGRAGSSAQVKLKKVTHIVAPGKLGHFTLKFPSALKSALRTLPHGKAVKLKLNASAKDVIGRIVTDKSTLKLKGAGR